MKIGIGYDVHKLTKGRELIIGGVLIPHDKGLLGHSDADVLIHAIIDALLGAAGLGDIGLLFPDTDNKFKDISSMDLLKEVRILINNEKFYIENIDSIIVAQKPKMRPYISIMEDNISKVLMIDKKFVNVKATTEESLGFTGKEEGISAKAICLLNCIKSNI